MTGSPITDAARDLYAKDPSTDTCGIELLEATPERSVVRMVVRDDMANGFAIGHGGMVFLLADSAMAFASNAAGGVALATSASIDWLAPAKLGDTLTATCELAHGPGKSKLWAITVSNQDRTVVALVNGRTRRVTEPAAS